MTKKTEHFSEEPVPPSTQEIESQKFKHMTLQEVIDSEDMEMLYDWFEENVMTGDASFEIQTQNGIESATIKQLDKETNTWIKYFTTDLDEIKRLKLIRDGKTVRTSAD